MTIKVVPHSEDFSAAVEAFNYRMREGGSPWGFYPDPIPDWMPKCDGAPAWREYYLAVEDDQIVRAGYALKPQQWWINGEVEWVTDWQGPFTEAAINPKYSALGLRLIRDMLAKYPLLYSLGHGGNDEPIVRLLRSMKWTLHETPFCLRVVKPNRFLRLNKYLRGKPWMKQGLDVLASTGTGHFGIKAVHAALAVRHGIARSQARAEVVDQFDERADALWERCRNEYACIAVRDRQMMNRLLPEHGWPGGTRLMIERDGNSIGWAVVHPKPMQDDHRFGNLFVGLVSDCFAAPQDAKDVIAATHDYLVSLGVDLICSNQSHPAWVAGFRSSGYLVLAGRRIFAASPQLRARLEPFSQTIHGLHLTNMDGHGPHGFETHQMRCFNGSSIL